MGYVNTNPTAELPDDAYIEVVRADLERVWEVIYGNPEVKRMPAQWEWEKESIPIYLVRALRRALVEMDRIHDPSVGIFDYDLRGTLQRLAGWEHGMDVCPRCHGEGFISYYAACPHTRADGKGPAHDAADCTNPDVAMEACPASVPIMVEWTPAEQGPEGDRA